MLVRSPTSSGRARRAVGRCLPSAVGLWSRSSFPSLVHERLGALPRSGTETTQSSVPPSCPPGQPTAFHSPVWRAESSQSSTESACPPFSLATGSVPNAGSRPRTVDSGPWTSSRSRYEMTSSLAFQKRREPIPGRLPPGNAKETRSSPDRAGRWARESPRALGRRQQRQGQHSRFSWSSLLLSNPRER